MGTPFAHGIIRVTTLALALVALLALVLARTLPAQAAGVVGTGSAASCTDPALTNAIAGGGNVTFNCGAAPVVIIVGSTKVITANTTVDGGGQVTLSGGNAVRVLKVNAGARLTLKNLTVSNGLVANDYGGGIRNSGTLIVDNSRIVNNRTTGSSCCSGGGGISNEGTLTVTNSELSGNVSVLGGGINSNGPTAIADSRIHDNSADESGGGVVIWIGGQATIRGGAIFSNTTTSNAVGGGAGIYNADRLALENVSVRNNASARLGGGIVNAGGVLTLSNVMLSVNTAKIGGGGLYNLAALRVNNSTINGNSQGGGTGACIYLNSGAVMIANSTLSDNFGDCMYRGGGSATLINVTVDENSGYGLVNDVQLKNTIVANNKGGANCLFFNPGVSLGYNLSDDSTCQLTGTGDRQGVPVLLAPLANNGGPTLTHMPLPGSPAIDNGTVVGCPPTDQRGAARPVGVSCDIGAVEYGAKLPWLWLPLVVR